MGLLNYFGLAKQIDAQATALSSQEDDEYFKTDPSTGFMYLNPSAAGVNVNESVAMTYSACWAATRLLAGTGGMLPFNFHRSLAGGGSEILYEHRLHRILHDEPNPEMSAMTFRASRINHQVNRGNCFAEIGRTFGGDVSALFPIHPSRIPAEQNIKRVNGRIVYLVNNNDGTKKEIKQENMFHVPSMITDDGVIGRGVVENARLSIGFGIAAEKHGAAYFGNGARPGIIIKGAKFKKAEDAEEFRRLWAETHGGPSKHGKPAILPPDADVTTLQFNAQDSQFLESRQHSIEEIARWYGVPPHLIGHLLRATFSNIEHQGIEFVKYSLMPWLKLWEQEVWRKLLTKEEQKTHYAKFNVDALERGDKASRTAASVQEVFNGLLTINDWAEREDMNPIGPLGDIHWTQTAMVPLEIAAKGPQAAAPNAEQGASEIDELKSRVEAYGIGVRAGAITPQLDDENQYREALGLPPMTEEGKAAWVEDKGIRRPITLRDPNAPASPFGQPKPEQPEEEPTDGGLSAARKEIAELRAKVEAVPHGLNGEAQELREQLAGAMAAQKQLATAMLNDVMARMVSLEVNAVKRVAEKPSRFDQRLREFYDKHRLTMERALAGPLAATAGNRGAMAIVEQHVTESLRQLDSLCDCQADELLAKVDECVSKWHEERATVTV